MDRQPPGGKRDQDPLGRLPGLLPGRSFPVPRHTRTCDRDGRVFFCWKRALELSLTDLPTLSDGSGGYYTDRVILLPRRLRSAGRTSAPPAQIGLSRHEHDRRTEWIHLQLTVTGWPSCWKPMPRWTWTRRRMTPACSRGESVSHTEVKEGYLPEHFLCRYVAGVRNVVHTLLSPANMTRSVSGDAPCGYILPEMAKCRDCSAGTAA